MFLKSRQSNYYQTTMEVNIRIVLYHVALRLHTLLVPSLERSTSFELFAEVIAANNVCINDVGSGGPTRQTAETAVVRNPRKRLADAKPVLGLR